MNKKHLIILITLIITFISCNQEDNTILTETCESFIFDGDVTLTTQQEVDAFGNEGYTEITGSLIVNNSNSITTLNSLNCLSLIKGGISVLNNFELLNLNGLDNIISIGGSLVIYNNFSLTNIKALSNITQVDNLIIFNNSNLVNINGLSNINSVEGNLRRFR